MRLLVLAGLAAGCLAAEELSPLPVKDPPKCEKATRTQFWPAEANRDARAAVRLAREEKLLICTRGAWKYAWKPVAVNLRAERERQQH
jgi:hypothetical protein